MCVKTLDFLFFSPSSIPGYIPVEPLFASIHKVLQPGIVGVRANTIPAAEIPDGSITTKDLENNADLLLGGELVAGNVDKLVVR